MNRITPPRHNRDDDPADSLPGLAIRLTLITVIFASAWIMLYLLHRLLS